MEEISIEIFKNYYENGQVKCLLDVRRDEEYKEVHVEGAKLIPLDQLTAEKVEELFPKSEVIYVICRSGGRSEKACKILESAIPARFINIDGGTLAAEAVGIPLVRGI